MPHPVPHVLSEEIASCSLVQSRCFRLSLAAAVLSRRKFANPSPLDFSAAQAEPKTYVALTWQINVEVGILMID